MKKLLNKYQHLWILSYFIIYLVWFGYVEKTVTNHFHVIHVALDDYIPFCEVFIIICFIVTYRTFVNSCEFFIAFSL